jgi:hypothetical protein
MFIIFFTGPNQMIPEPGSENSNMTESGSKKIFLLSGPVLKNKYLGQSSEAARAVKLRTCQLATRHLVQIFIIMDTMQIN